MSHDVGPKARNCVASYPENGQQITESEPGRLSKAPNVFQDLVVPEDAAALSVSDVTVATEDFSSTVASTQSPLRQQGL